MRMESAPLPEHEQQKIERLQRAMYSRTLSEKLKNKERRQLAPEKEIVRENWVREEPTISGSVIAPRTINLTRTVLWWFLGAASIFFLSAALFFNLFFRCRRWKLRGNFK